MRKIILILIILLSISVSKTEKKIGEDLVKQESEIIQMEGDLRRTTKERDFYRKEYEREVFWGNIKEIVVLVAIVAL